MFTRGMGTVGVEHLARGATAGIKQAEKIWQIPGSHFPAVTILQGSKKQWLRATAQRGAWCLAVQDGGVEGAPGWFCGRKGQMD